MTDSHRAPSTSLRLWSVVALLLIAACVTQAPPDEVASLSVSPTSMEGVTRATLQVQASGSWTLSVTADDPVLAANTSLSLGSGTGPRTVTLVIDPTGVSPTRHLLKLWLNADGRDGPVSVSRELAFSFPRVYGTVVVHPGDPLHGEQRQTSPNRGASGRESSLASGPLPSAADAVPNPDGSVTLIVAVDRTPELVVTALEASDAGAGGRNIGATPLAGIAPAAADSIAALGNASIALSFPAAGVLLLDVPASETEAAMQRLASSPGIRGVTPSIELESHQLGFPNDFHYPRQWGFASVDMEPAWQLARGAGVTIAVIDGGFYPAHPDLSGKVVGQYDFGDGKTDVTVQHAICGTHGTHVAGIAAAATDNVIGVAGAAPAAGLLLLDIDRYDAGTGRCPMTTAALVAALQYVYNDGAPRAQVVNMSLGSSSALGQGVEDALETLYIAGVALVASSGNDDRQCPSGTTSSVAYPAAYFSVWAIGATRPDDARACYSQVGPELFLAAPGGEQWYGPTDADMIFSTVYDVSSGTADYGYMQGTSMASPLVAGVVALMMHAEPGASLFEIEQALIDTALDLGPAGKDNQYGYGLVMAGAAVAALADAEPPPPDPLGLILDVERYPLTPLGHHREFVLVDSVTGLVTIYVYSDDDDDGIPGEPGEYYGTATIDVEFDKHNAVTIDVWRQ